AQTSTDGTGLERGDDVPERIVNLGLRDLIAVSHLGDETSGGQNAVDLATETRSVNQDEVAGVNELTTVVLGQGQLLDGLVEVLRRQRGSVHRAEEVGVPAVLLGELVGDGGVLCLDSTVAESAGEVGQLREPTTEA